MVSESTHASDVAIAYNNAHYLAYHCWTLGYVAREYVDGKLCSFIDTVPMFRQRGDRLLEAFLVLFTVPHPHVRTDISASGRRIL